MTALLCLALPASAIVVSGSDPHSQAVTIGQTVYGLDLSGVVMVTSDIGGCSGSLLPDGLSILTAGHCVTSAFGNPIANNIQVTFNGPSGPVTDSVSGVSVNPGYTGDSTQGGDIAVLHLSNPSPSFAIGYSLFTGDWTSDPTVLAGYGYTGTGLTGGTGGYGSLNAGENEYEVNGAYFSWSANLLIGEFYQTGQPNTNALFFESGLDPNPYDAADQVDIAHGDSGGPTFYNGMLIGVHDLGICFGDTSCDVPPAVSADNNSYFGDLYGDVSVAAYSDWITAQEATPEPGTLALAGLGMCLVGWARRRQQGLRSASARTLRSSSLL